MPTDVVSSLVALSRSLELPPSFWPSLPGENPDLASDVEPDRTTVPSLMSLPRWRLWFLEVLPSGGAQLGGTRFDFLANPMRECATMLYT
jgi:hypothetical protein